MSTRCEARSSARQKAQESGQRGLQQTRIMGGPQSGVKREEGQLRGQPRQQTRLSRCFLLLFGLLILHSGGGGVRTVSGPDGQLDAWQEPDADGECDAKTVTVGCRSAECVARMIELPMRVCEVVVHSIETATQ